MLVQDEPLDDNYAKGYSYDDYSKGTPAPWIELGEEQLAFKEANPKATVKEIIEAKLWEFVCAGGGDGDFIREIAAELKEELGL